MLLNIIYSKLFAISKFRIDNILLILMKKGKLVIKKLVLFVVIVCIFYFFGAITVQYKLFPFEQIVKIKNSFKEKTTVLNISPYYLHKVSQFDKLAYNDEFSIVMLGDSITDGVEWYELLENNKIQNRGISGDTTYGVLNRLGSINKSIKKVFIMIGINDIASYKSVDEIYNNYLKIIEILEKEGTKVYIQSILYLGNDYLNAKKFNLQVSELNLKLQNLAKNKNIVFINLNSIFASTGYLEKKYTSDEIHLNGEAYVLWAEAIKPYIKE